MDTLVRFSANFDTGDNFCNFLFALLYNKPPKKEVYFKGSKFFPFRVDPFQKGCKQFCQVLSHESVSIPLNKFS